ncbi:MAG TPA: hypothetical protein VFM18_07255, partial [Methanosarcina sp.]|nr:hypothetical protein [Methanosarcina sp.]
MPLVRKASELLSREIRKTATGGQILRKLDNKAPIDKNQIWEWIKGVAGWAGQRLMDAITGNIMRFRFSDGFRAMVDGFITIYNWDFNVTDEVLEQRVKALNKQIKVTIAGQVGRTIGTVVAAGIGIGGAFAINAQMGMYLLQDAGTEIVQDWVSEVSGAILQIKNIEEQKAVIRRFQNYRRAMKLIYRIPGLAELLGADPQAIQQWGKEKREPWSFAKQVNNFVQKLPGDWADIAEEFLEELGEAVVETGFIIAGSLDSFFFDEALRDTPGQIN